MYLTYGEYVALGGAAVDETAFAPLERKAGHYMEYYTQDRVKYLTTIPPEAKEAMTEIINILANSGAGETGEKLASFSNGKVSMSFDLSQTESQQVQNIIMTYLPLSLTRRGVDKCV
jgi:hypothetical protein